MKGCRSLNHEEIEKVKKCFKGKFQLRDRALFMLGIYTGLRISELLSIKVGDVIQDGRLVERIGVKRHNTKGKHEGRVLLFHPKAQLAVEAWVTISGLTKPNDCLFHTSSSTLSAITRQQAWRILRRAFARAGLTGQLGTHTLR